MEKCLCKVFLRCKLGTRVYFSFAFPLNKITLLLKIYFLFYVYTTGWFQININNRDLLFWAQKTDIQCKSKYLRVEYMLVPVTSAASCFVVYLTS